MISKEFPSPLEVTWVINIDRKKDIMKQIMFPSPLEVTWVINLITQVYESHWN